MSVIANIYSPKNEKINSDPVELFDSGDISANGDSTKGDFVYSNKFQMSNNYPVGSYEM